MKSLESLNRPLARKVFFAAAGLLVLWTVAGFLLLPRLLRPLAERKLSEALHRPVALRKLSLNPFTLAATLEGLDVKERGGAGPFFSFERLYVNLEAISIFKGGPVVRAVTLTKPSISLVRNQDGTYNVQDLLDEASRPKPPGEKPLRFSVNNIHVEGGSVDFDDRPMRTKHTVRDIAIGIPFLSNIPSQVDIRTQPDFEAKINGAPFALHGSTKPFSQTRETSVDLNIADLDLPHYLAYVPASMLPKLASGRLDTNLTLSFAQPPKGTPRLVLSGTAALRKLATEIGGTPLLTCERFEASLGSFDVFARRAWFRSLKAVEPELWVRRAKTGAFEVLEALAAPAAKREEPAAKGGTKAAGKTAAKPAREPETQGRDLVIQVAAIGIEKGRIHYDDVSFPTPFHAVFGDVAVSVRGFSTAPGKAATLEIAARSDAGETFKNTGTVSIEPSVLEGEFAVGSLPLKRYAPFYSDLVRFDVENGVLDLKTKYRFSAGPKGNTTLTGLSAELRSAYLKKRGEKSPFFAAPALTVAQTDVDLGGRAAVVGEIASKGGTLAVARGKDGSVDLASLMAGPPARASGPPQAHPSAPWTLALGKLALDGYTVKIEDNETVQPARYTLTGVNLLLEKLSTARGSKAALDARFGINGKGVASAKGPIGFDPMFADLKAEVRRIPLVPIQAYVVQSLNLSLARGSLSAAGTLKFGEGADGKAMLTYSGNALVADMLAVDRATNLDFVGWESFSASGMKAGFNPMFLNVSQLALSGLACDFTIEADGTTSFQRILGAPAAKSDEEEAEGASPAGTPAASAAPAAAPAPAPTPAASPPVAANVMPVRIDTLVLQGGRIGIADRLVKPNYSATLVDVAGRVTGLSSQAGTIAQLELRGTLANHSPLQVAGSINPFSAAAFADVKASFRNIDLPPFTPYSGKYAGYAIARGGLTMEVSYKLQNRKLAAENHFLVDQFEFGDRVESKEATSLPVKLAVSLLKDKDGVIDLDLPIEGSLDDPKFRLGKVIWKVLGNLIAKAVTAPFSLLGKLLGGGGQEFSSVDFADGSDRPDEAAKKKLDALARALENRPALKLEATGRFSGDADREGLKRLLIQRKVKAQKLADLAKKGEAPKSVDDVVVGEKEYETWLAKAYKKEKFPKPRNVLGIAKSLPASEMENLMLANITVTDDDLRQLALARANAVKGYLTGVDKIDAARVFVLEPGAKPSAPADKVLASRVDFALR